MFQKLFFILLVFTVLTFINGQQYNRRFRPHAQFRVTYEWNLLDFRWPSAEDKIRAVRNSQYIPENNVIAGIEMYHNRMFLTLPRWRHGVPATLVWVPGPNVSSQTAPLLNPFPSWELNKLGDCRALQNVQSVEVDLYGVLWVLDGGRTATMEPNPDTTCPPRLILFDLNNGNVVVREYVFPNEVALHDGSFLNDIVIDDYNGRFAYISDNSNVDPGIIVFSLSNNTSWKIRDPRSMNAEPDATQFIINGTVVDAAINLDSIALGPASWGPTRDLIYSPLSSFHFYSISTTVLRNMELSRLPTVTNFIKEIGFRPSQTDGMIMDEFGTLYFGLLGENAIAHWNISRPLLDAQRMLLARDSIYLQWPDSFAIDEIGNLYVTTNRLQNFLIRNVRATEANYRVLVANIGARSYLYGNRNFDQYYNTQQQNAFYPKSNTLGPEGRAFTSTQFPLSSSSFDPSQQYFEPNGNQLYRNYPSSTPSISIYPMGQNYDPILSTSTIGNYRAYNSALSSLRINILILLFMLLLTLLHC